MRRQFIAATLFVAVVGIVTYVVTRRAWIDLPAGRTLAPLAVPDYDAYDYGIDAKVIDVGTQPAGTPATFLTECLFHDRILQQQLSAHGWQLREHGYRNGREMLPYGDGRLKVMVLGDIPALLAVQKFRLGIFAVCSQGYNAVVARSRIVAADLKGRAVGYPSGTAAHFALERALASGGLTSGEIRPVALDPAEMVEALRSKRVAAVATWEPIVTDILYQIRGSAVISSSATYTFLVLDLDFVDQHPELAQPLLAATVRATRWGASDEQNLRINLLWDRRATIGFFGSSAVEPNDWWVNRLRQDTVDNPSFPMLPLALRDPQSLQHQQFQWLQQAGMLPRSNSWERTVASFKTGLLPEVIRDAARWQIDAFDYCQDKLYQKNR